MNHIGVACPLPQVDQAAALAAKGPEGAVDVVLVQLLARRTLHHHFVFRPQSKLHGYALQPRALKFLDALDIVFRPVGLNHHIAGKPRVLQSINALRPYEPKGHLLRKRKTGLFGTGDRDARVGDARERKLRRKACRRL